MPDRDPPHQATHERHRLPLVWLVPIVAIFAAGWLGYRTLSERGPVIAITLQSADGIEAGKTRIRHKQVELGVVSDMEPNADLSLVTVHVQMNRYADGHLNTGTRFWVVRPRLSAEGISGLGTLISGAYMEMEPGPGTPTRRFVAQEDPPVVNADVPGTEYVLHAQRLGSIGHGAPVSFHGIKVGEVLGTTLSDDDGSGTVRVFVRAPHDRLVHEGTRFWNASGVSVELGADGLRLQTDSLQAILAGGVTFDVPQGGEPGGRANPSSAFTLYSDADQARDALYTRKVQFLLHLPGNAQGLSAGAPVHMRGIRVGEVTDVHMEYDAATRAISIPVTIELEPQRVRIFNSVSTGSNFTKRSYAVFKEFVADGLRAQLVSGNLLTGQKIISLDFVKDAAKASMIEGGVIPEIPVAETDGLDAMMQTAKRLLSSLGDTAASLNQIIVSPEVKRSLVSLDQSLAHVNHLTLQADLQAGPLLTGLRGVSNSADRTLKQATATLATTGSAFGTDSGGGDLAGTLDELKQAARSLRALTDYLESHPGSLIRGKTAMGEP